MTLIILLIAVVAFVSNRVPVGVVAILVALALWATGVLTLQESFAGFGDPTVLFIASLFVVSEGLDATGVTTWAGQKVIALAGTSRRKLLVLVMLLVAVLSALISVNGAVAALLPVVVVVAVRMGMAPSKMLLPLAFAAHAGSLLALTGTPVNIIVSEAAVDAGERPFTFFEFGLVGLPLVVGTLLITMAFGSKLLPERTAALMPRDLSDHARTLHEFYALPSESADLIHAAGGVTEVVIPPRSDLIGLRVYAGMVTPSGELVVLAVHRKGEELEGQKTTLVAGDTLLVEGSWAALDQHTADPDVLVVDSPDRLRRTIPLGPRAPWAIGILILMVLLLATGVVPAAVASLLAAIAMVLTRTVSVTDAYRSISWTTVVLVAGMIPLSTAFMQTGAADLIADGLLSAVGDSGPQVALFALCLITVVLGQLISNTATVLIVIPVAAAVAHTMDVSVLPFLMGLAVAGAASFLTPIATPANMMVMGPGGYKFTDYWKLGLPLLALFLAVATFYVPIIWHF